VHRDAVLGADFSPDGRTLATCSRDGSVQVSPLAYDELLALARRRLEALSADEPTDH
jgi:WD40 repeat protein